MSASGEFQDSGAGGARAVEAGADAAKAHAGMFSLIRQDLRRYLVNERARGLRKWFGRVRLLLDTPGLQAVLIFRFTSWVETSVRFWLFRYPLKLIAYILEKLSIILWGIYIHEQARIGGGLYVGHFGGIVIGPVKMGCDCNVAQQVSIGRRAGGYHGVPTMGDRVWIGAGSVVFGKIHIGDGATIGPLTVVSRNLPPRVLVMGNPMRLIRKDYDNSTELYGFDSVKSRSAQVPDHGTAVDL